ncbi:MAG TPA: DnaJ domain-containing protein, partial [Thermomicrobiales bacterium]|nr:DnaJ domain-containing protein [Thermomicrobiales bacterium]
MFLGSQQDVAHLGYVLGTCPKCGTQGVFTVYEAKRRLTFYAVAALPMGQQQVLECRACGTRFAIPPEMKADLKQRLISADQLADYVAQASAGMPLPKGVTAAQTVPVRTLYQVLQVDSAADPDVIEAAFKRLAFKYHPDRNKSPEAPAKMRELLDAKRVLSDSATRRA